VPSGNADRNGHDVRAGEIGRLCASPVEHRADLAGEHEVGVDNHDGRTLTASRAVARQCRLDAAGPGRTTAGLRAHDCGHQHVTTAVEGLAQQRTERTGGCGVREGDGQVRSRHRPDDQLARRDGPDKSAADEVRVARVLGDGCSWPSINPSAAIRPS
jgi:hypothetical protein